MPNIETSVSASIALAEPIWRLAGEAALRMRYWDDECVLFHGATGDTHRLPDVVGRLLERIAAAPAGVAALSDAIDLHQDDVALSLAELERLDIVEMVR